MIYYSKETQEVTQEQSPVFRKETSRRHDIPKVWNYAKHNSSCRGVDEGNTGLRILIEMIMELQILNYIQEHFRTVWGDQIMTFITHLGDHGLIWICLGIVLLFFKKTRKAGFTLLIALLIELLIANITLKPLIARQRPFTLNPDVDLLIPVPKDFSFPSGHTGASFAAIFALAFNRCRLWLPSLILGCLIAYSRMYIYVHFPTDILGGVGCGLVSALISWLIIGLFAKKIPGRLGPEK